MATLKKLSDLKSLKGWNEDYNLPLFEHTNNTFIYLAYACKALEVSESEKENIKLLLQNTPLLSRHNSTIQISHDEVLGKAYLANFIGYEKTIGYELWITLEAQGGQVGPKEYRDNLFRKPELEGSVSGFIGHKINPIDEIIIAFTIIRRALKKDDGTSHHLRTWILEDIVKKTFIAKIAFYFWKKSMKKRKTLPEMLAIETGIKEFKTVKISWPQ